MRTHQTASPRRSPGSPAGARLRLVRVLGFEQLRRLELRNGRGDLREGHAGEAATPVDGAAVGGSLPADGRTVATVSVTAAFVGRIAYRVPHRGLLSHHAIFPDLKTLGCAGSCGVRPRFTKKI